MRMRGIGSIISKYEVLGGWVVSLVELEKGVFEETGAEVVALEETFGLFGLRIGGSVQFFDRQGLLLSLAIFANALGFVAGVVLLSMLLEESAELGDFE